MQVYPRTWCSSASLRLPVIARSSLAILASSMPALVLSSVLLHPSTAVAQATASATGSVMGRVSDSNTGKFLEGAEVSVAGTSLHTFTDREGRFSFPSVPTGAQTITVNYVGMTESTIPVTVAPGSNEPVSVRLGSDVVELSTMVVSSDRTGMAQAVALQKVSIQSKMVAAADQFGPVSEGNVGEYLKFLPGISIDYNVNDARGVSMRGLSTAFTIVAVDGTPMAGASSTDDTRRFEFEQIAMNNVETTEVYKTVTPDIPATATGGFVNFVTKSAFDTEEIQTLSYDLSFSGPSSNFSTTKEGGVWGNRREYTVRPNVEMNFARRLSEKVGVNFNYRLSEKYDDSPRTEFTWNTGTAAPTVMTNPRLQQYNIRDEQKLTHRQAFAAKVDYRVSDDTQLMLSGQWNWYDLNFTQRGPQFVLGTSATRTGDDTFTSGSNGQIQNNVLYRNKYGTTVHFNGRLSHTFGGGSKLEVTPYWSRSDGQYRDTNKGFISSTAVLAPGATTYTNFTVANPSTLGQLPTITLSRNGQPVDFGIVRSLSRYTLSNTTGTNFQSRPWTAEDEKEGVRADYTVDFKQLRTPLTVAAGIALDKTHRMIDRPDIRGNIPATTGSALLALLDPNYTADVAYGFGSYEAVDPFKVYEAFKDRPTILSAYDTRNIDEDNEAAYIRVDAEILPDLMLAGGVRYEKRTIEAAGRTGSPARARLSTADIEFDDLYPSLMLKYTPRRNLVLRAGYSQTIGIPDYGEILPTFVAPSTATSTDGTISIPAAGLQPYSSSNYDIGLDFYLKNSGVISVSAYRKDVDDYIIARPMTAEERNGYLADYGFDPAEFGVTAGTVRENGSKSRLQGIEISYAQNLSMLPKPFNGLSVQANYTYIEVDTYDSDRFRAIDTLYSQLRAVSPRTFNFILGYRIGKFNTTITTNWVDESLYGGFVNTNYFTGSANTANPAADTRLTLNKYEKTTTDIKVEYAFNRHVSAYLLVRNVFNTPREEFLRGYLPENRHVVLPLRYFEFGEPHVTVGVRGTF